MNIYSLCAALFSASALLMAGTTAHAATESVTPDAGKVITITQNSAFITPSGKAICLMYVESAHDKAGVRCDLMHGAKVTTAPAPADCELDWGIGMTLARTAGVSCVGDTIAGTPRIGGEYATWWQKAKTPIVMDHSMKNASLPYGYTMKSRDMSCTTAPTGTTCINLKTKHGFTMWAGGHKTF